MVTSSHRYPAKGFNVRVDNQDRPKIRNIQFPAAIREVSEDNGWGGEDVLPMMDYTGRFRRNRNPFQASGK